MKSLVECLECGFAYTVGQRHSAEDCAYNQAGNRKLLAALKKL
jgi:hypothetical protein